MTKATATQPGTVVRALLRVATDTRQERFVATALVEYFDRIMSASNRKLKSYGLRPVVAPVAVEFALSRAKGARTYLEFIARLIEDDAYVGELAMRAVQFYSASMQAHDSAAFVVNRNLSCIAPALH